MTENFMVAIPAYNCADQIARVLNQITPEFSEFFGEVIVIDNRSSDETLSRAVEKAKSLGHIKTTVVQNCENYNLGGSHKVAFHYCLDKGYDGVIILHGDDQGSISDFYPLLKSQRQLQYDCVLGARFQKGSKLFGYSAVRICGNYLFNWLFSVVVMSKVYDMGSGLNLYRKSIVNAGFYKFMPDDLTFNNCMLLATFAHRYKVAFEPITWREEDQVSNAKLANQAIKLIKYLFLFFFNKKSFFCDNFRSNKRSSYPYEVVYQSHI